MTRITKVQLPKTDKGNDPWDNRNVDGYLEPIPSQSDDIWSQFEITEDEIERYKKGFWLYENLLWHNHVSLFIAPANGGKTTVAMHIAEEIAKNGDYDVVYINADVDGADGIEYLHRAKRAGFRLILPDLANQSAHTAYKILCDLSMSGSDLTKSVFIIDSLKSMADMINKSSIKPVMQTFRSLAGSGATVLLLGHANKKPDFNGKWVYEGTNDVRDYVSELYYLYSDQHKNGLTITIQSDKKRLAKKPELVTFELDLEGQLTRSDVAVDIKKAKEERAQLARDKNAIGLIYDALRDGLTKQTDIAKYVSENGVGKVTATNVLKRYANRPVFWTSTKGPNNSCLYKKMATPSENQKTR